MGNVPVVPQRGVATPHTPAHSPLSSSIFSQPNCRLVFSLGVGGRRSCSPINFSASNCLASLELRLGFVAEYPPLHPLSLRHCACLLRGCQHTQRSRGVWGHKETAASVRILKRISCPLLPTPSSLSLFLSLFVYPSSSDSHPVSNYVSSSLSVSASVS